METFSAILAICSANSPATAEFPAQRLVTRSFDVFLDLRPKEWLSKQWRFGDLSRHYAHYDVIVIKLRNIWMKSASIKPKQTLKATIKVKLRLWNMAVLSV